MTDRKENLIIFSTIIFLTIVLYSFFNSFNIYSIKNIATENNTSIINEKPEIKYVINSLKSKEVVNSNSKSKIDPFPLMITNLGNKQKKYYLYFDISNKNIYYENQTQLELYKIEESNEMFFFLNDTFKEIYLHSAAPNLTISSSNASISNFEKINWSYKKIDDAFYSRTTDNNLYNSNTIFKSEDNLSFVYSLTPAAINYTLYKDDKHITSDKIENQTLSIPTTNGSYSLIVDSSFYDANDNYSGNITSLIDFTVDLPATFTVDKTSLKQGDLLSIAIKNLKDGETPFIEQSIYKDFKFDEIKNSSSKGLIPTSYITIVDNYTISYGVNKVKLGEFNISVTPGDFNIQHLVIDEKIQASTQTDEAYTEFDKYVTPLRDVSASAPYFSDSFIAPLKGYLTTEYGETRYVNGAPTSYFHSGLDIAAPTGTPVIASNTGKVMLSRKMILTGNTVLIDHGNGFMSIYYHMNSLNVKKDDIVERGGEIGEVGTTGFSTGPHLHFIIGYYDNNVAPGLLIYDENVTYQNFRTLFNKEDIQASSFSEEHRISYLYYFINKGLQLILTTDII